MKIEVTLTVNVDQPSETLIAELRRLRNATVTTMEMIITQGGAIPSTEIRVSEIFVDDKPIMSSKKEETLEPQLVT